MHKDIRNPISGKRRLCALGAVQHEATSYFTPYLILTRGVCV